MNSAQNPNNVDRYGSGAIAFHWFMFALVVCVGTLGLLHDSWPKQTQRFWINIHALLGLLLWFTLMARFWWRTRHAPPLMQSVGAFARRTSTLAHFGLYALLFVTPIVGIITFIYHGRVFDFGIFKIDFGIKSNRAIFHPTEDLHGYLAYAIFALVGIHALAALWHQFILRDGLLARMWPARR
ncbi:MAG: cytochrome b/b6 domain-containing protein [Steroidobacteraceae bacterium]